MEKTEMIQFAIKGMDTDIQEHDKMVRKGENIMNDMIKGNQTKTKMTYNEVKEVVKEHRTKIAELEGKRSDLQWELIEL